MLRSMDSAVAGLRAHQNKLDVISNNIANVNTFGFKSQSYSFKEAMYQTSSASSGAVGAGGTNASQYGYGTMMGSIVTDMGNSTPSYVGGFNASINGEGFFVTMSSNVVAGIAVDEMKKQALDYSRVGQFTIDANGFLVDANGNFIYGFQPDGTAAGGFQSDTMFALRAPVGMNGNDPSFDVDPSQDALQIKDIKLNELGEITGTIVAPGEAYDQKAVSLGKLAVATFQNPNGLSKKGQNYYGATEGDNSGAGTAAVPGGSTAKLMTGYLEASNVDLAREFAEMITTQRGFQANSKIITVSDEILADLVNMKR